MDRGSRILVPSDAFARGGPLSAPPVDELTQAIVRYALQRGMLSTMEVRRLLLLREEMARMGPPPPLLGLVRQQVPAKHHGELSVAYRQAQARQGSGSGSGVRPSWSQDDDASLPAAPEAPPEALMRSDARLQRPPEEDPETVRQALARLELAQPSSGSRSGRLPRIAPRSGSGRLRPFTRQATLGGEHTLGDPDGGGSGHLASPSPEEAAAAARGRARVSELYQQVCAHDPHFAPHADVVLQRLGELGRGGMGVVYRVRDERLGREAALKRIRGEASPRQIERFTREARITASLNHPAIPPVFEFGTDASGRHYLLMQVIAGAGFDLLIADIHRARRDVEGSLGVRLARRRQRRGAGEWDELLEVLIKVAEAVAYAHSKGIVHRDLKPANVIVGTFGEVMVMDWGLARDLSVSKEEDDALLGDELGNPGQLTQDGAAVGTVGYMPPEQARGRAGTVTPAADVYALGAILTTILTGRPPVSERDPLAGIYATAEGNITLPRARDPRLPQELDELAAKALALDPTLRPTAEELADDLRAYLAGGEVSVHAYTARERALRNLRRHPTRVVGVTLGGLLLMVTWLSVAAIYVQRQRSRLDQQVEDQRQEQARRRVAEEGRTQVQAQLVENLIAQADLLASSERWAAADEKYGEARAILAERGELTTLADLGSWARWRQAPSRVCRLKVGESARDRALSRDGRWALSAEGEALALWDLPHGALVRRWRAHRHASRAAFSPDGESLLSAGRDGELACWERATGELRWRRAIHDGEPLTLHWHPASASILSADSETFAVLDPEDGAIRHLLVLADEDDWVGLGTCADRPLVLTVDQGRRRLRLLDLEAWDVLGAWNSAREVTALAIAPGGRLAVVGHEDGSLVVHGLPAGEERYPLGELGAEVGSVQVSPDGSRVLALGEGRVAVWGLDSRRELARFELPVAWKGGLEPSADGRLLLSGTRHEHTLWHLTRHPALRELGRHQGAALAVTPLGERLVASGGQDGRIRVWDPAVGLQLSELDPDLDPQLTEGRVQALAAAGEGVLAAGEGPYVVRWRLPTSEPEQVLGPLPGTVEALALTPDGSRLAAGSHGFPSSVLDLHGPQGRGHPLRETFADVAALGMSCRRLALRPDGTLRIELRDGSVRDRPVETVAVWEHPEEDPRWRGVAGSTHGLHWLPNGLLLRGGLGATLGLWSAEGTLRQRVASERADPLDLAPVVAGFIPRDTGLLLALEQGERVVEWDLSQQRLVRSFGEGVTAMVQGHEPRLLYTGHDDGRLTVWQLDTGRLLRSFPGHAGTVHALARLPGREYVVSVGEDGRVLAWDFAAPADERGASEALEGAGDAATRLRVRARQLARAGCADWASELEAEAREAGAPRDEELEVRLALLDRRWSDAALALERGGEVTDPARALQLELARRETRAEELLRAGRRLLGQERWDAAYQRLDALVQARPTSAQAFVLRGRAALNARAGRNPEADYHRAFALDPDVRAGRDPLILLKTRCNWHLQAERFAEAVEDATRIIARSPEPEANMFRVRAQNAQRVGRPELALADLDRAVELGCPDLPQARAQTCVDLGRWDQATAAYAEVFAQQTALDAATAATFLLAWARAHMKLGELSEARELLERVVELQPTFNSAISVPTVVGYSHYDEEVIERDSPVLQVKRQHRPARPGKGLRLASYIASAPDGEAMTMNSVAYAFERVVVPSADLYEAHLELARIFCRLSAQAEEPQSLLLEQALDHLRQAVSAGLQDGFRIHEDPDLGPLHRHPEYGALLGKRR